jgi:hypothetical protein
MALSNKEAGMYIYLMQLFLLLFLFISTAVANDMDLTVDAGTAKMLKYQTSAEIKKEFVPSHEFTPISLDFTAPEAFNKDYPWMSKAFPTVHCTLMGEAIIGRLNDSVEERVYIRGNILRCSNGLLEEVRAVTYDSNGT